MTRLWTRITRWFRFGAKDRKSAEELQEDFRRRYRLFRALLTANNAILEIMAEMAAMLEGSRSYGMAFVRGRSTAVMVNGYKMVRNLLEMADGRHAELEAAFDGVRQRLERVLAGAPPPADGPWILPLQEINRHLVDQVGAKMANLGEVANGAGLPVPPGFAVTAAAAHYFISTAGLLPEIDRRLQTVDVEDYASLYEKSAEIQQMIAGAPLPDDLAAALLTHFDRLEKNVRPGLTVAMRSSALGEDAGDSSFAGQYRTELYVERDYLCQAYKEIVASKYSSRALVYRLLKGHRDKDIVMAVGCLAMVEGHVSGVMYSRAGGDHLSGLVGISAAAGGARLVVDGTVQPERLEVLRSPPQRVVHRESVGQADVDLSARTPVPPCLADQQAAVLARMALRLEEHFGEPQDIEWSIDQAGDTSILQSRPLAQVQVEGAAAPPTTGEEGASPPLLRGRVTASPGVACGPVFILQSGADLLRFQQGSVLVTAHPLPEWASLLGRAVAVLAETGSEAGHLATVARELGIPALFGIRDSLRQLGDGQLVTVDAGRRAVYDGRRDDILANALPRPNLMQGSRVQAALREILAQLTPLNLVDPQSPYFRPEQCRTLHDITRFCHEKAVAEMFSFGEKHSFDARSAKRLVGEVPLEWWVIDLADGFRAEFDQASPTVTIADIVSDPMLALWQGMRAIPWQGPPPVSARGFGSILFRSTMMPGFDPAVRSAMSGRNYFLVSAGFCNLSVRLGYHFAMVEAYLGDLLTESYVSFTFKGGAADERRRDARVRLLAEVLEKLGFRVRVQGDELVARVEKQPRVFLRQRLMALGYLVLHARQIDMVMGSTESLVRYRDKFACDIKKILAEAPGEGQPGREKEYAV
ncbi:MAG: hypothetical protein BWK76_24930 [Desulfobulbaceae bacterium A2]|nr:MAG: hypothetical protein BWK76_24930 [Desulfobulbaceae bacterium A2]